LICRVRFAHTTNQTHTKKWLTPFTRHPRARKKFEPKLVEKYLKIKTVNSKKRCIFVKNLQDIKNQSNDVP